jgi:cytochrome c peroxidase
VRRQQTGFRSTLSYFYNGFAADLDAVVEFYDTRFNVGFSAQEKADLIAFLRAL